MPRLVPRSARPRIRRSVIATNMALAVAVGALCWLDRVAGVPAPPAARVLLAGAAGVWLFYVQHQFEDTYWQSAGDWSYADAALRGSSYLRLPKVLQFFSGNIGLHHVHHLSAKVPNYNLQRAHDRNEIFHAVPTLSLWDGLRAVRLKLWDEGRGRLVTFAEARHSMADRDDLEFTYSLIDRIFRLSLGELADFSGAKYDGDFSLSLEEAQRRKHEYVAEQIGIGPGRRVLDVGCGWGPLLDFVRRRGGTAVGVTLSSAQAEACRRHGLDAHLQDARQITPRRPRPLRRGRQPGRLRALLLAGGPRAPAARTRSTATSSPGSRACSPTAAGSISRRWCSGAT